MEWNIPMQVFTVLPDSNKGRKYAHAHDMPHGNMSACPVCNRAIMLRFSISQTQAACVLDSYQVRVDQASEAGIVMNGVL